MRAEVQTIAITTDASGNFTGYSAVVNGRVLEVRLVVPGSGGIEATSDITITNELTGAQILALTDQNGSGTWAPRQATHSTAGAAALYAAGGTAVNAHVVVAESRIKVVVAQGGNAKTATLYVTVG